MGQELRSDIDVDDVYLEIASRKIRHQRHRAQRTEPPVKEEFGSGRTEDKGREDVRHGNKNHDHSQHDYNRNSEY